MQKQNKNSTLKQQQKAIEKQIQQEIKDTLFLNLIEELRNNKKIYNLSVKNEIIENIIYNFNFKNTKTQKKYSNYINDIYYNIATKSESIHKKQQRPKIEQQKAIEKKQKEEECQKEKFKKLELERIKQQKEIYNNFFTDSLKIIGYIAIIPLIPFLLIGYIYIQLLKNIK